ncbi:AraC family transcriptional regulator [Variovorax saccharolyticus]|uniref:AraC family transcriptional regulator n=1 Tax=Variovorax saccharolyticus TaxID=3053516 RepID=UPI0025785ED4|nr:AraC family transcriptional regulator [Variovorax sp. J22R187]MDM0021413.1 AraC family transcriptional regulator [Variovorax sp. J22R187]
MPRKPTGRPSPAMSSLLFRHGSGDMETPSESTLGLPALVETLAGLGVDAAAVLEGTGISPLAITDHNARLSQRQKFALFDNVERLSPDPAIGLLAGQRQRIPDFGVFGYVLLSSATLGEAVNFGIQHVRLAGPVLEKSFRIEGEVAIFEGRDVLDLGRLLPLATEFWFSSIVTLMGRILERPFQPRRMLLPYPAPACAARYPEILNCPVSFAADAMQMQFDAALLALPLPNANPITASLSADFCGRMLEAIGGENLLVKSIKEACLNSAGAVPRAEDMAARLHVSTRTLHRRLADAGTSYQDIIDGVRKRLAVELLERTELSVDKIAERSGFADTSNFRKAFRKWTGQTPAFFRERRG